MSQSIASRPDENGPAPVGSRSEAQPRTEGSSPREDVPGGGGVSLPRATIVHVCQEPGRKQVNPAVAYNPVTNDCFVAWVDWIQSETDKRYVRPRILGKRLVEGIFPEPCPVVLSSPAGWFELTDNDVYPVLACDTAGYQLVLWTAGSNLATGDRDIQGRFISPDGTPDPDPFLASWQTKAESAPALVCAGIDTFFAAWSHAYSPTDIDIHGRFVAREGVPYSTPGGTNQDREVAIAGTGRNEINATVAYNETDGECLVVWIRDGALYTRVCKYNQPATGPTLLEARTITTSHPVEGIPRVVWNGTLNEYLVVWQWAQGGTDRNICATIMTKAGAWSSESTVVSGPLSELRPAVVYNPDKKEYLVVFQHLHPPNDWDLDAVRLNSKGQPVEPPFAIANKSANEGRASVSYNRQRLEYLIVWQDLGPGEGGTAPYYILACALDSDGKSIYSHTLSGPPDKVSRERPASGSEGGR